jgi:hypothetical protein
MDVIRCVCCPSYEDIRMRHALRRQPCLSYVLFLIAKNHIKSDGDQLQTFATGTSPLTVFDVRERRGTRCFH